MDRIPTKTKWEIPTFLHWAIPEKSKQQGGRGVTEFPAGVSKK